MAPRLCCLARNHKNTTKKTALVSGLFFLVADFYRGPDADQGANCAKQQAPAAKAITMVKHRAKPAADQPANGYANEYHTFHAYLSLAH